MDRILVLRELRRQREREDRRISRRRRDASDPLALPNIIFLQRYRLSKDLYRYLVEELRRIMPPGRRSTALPLELKVLTTLSLLGTGAYQRLVGQDWLVSMSQPSISRAFKSVLEHINALMGKYIVFPMTPADRVKVKLGFFQKTGMPGVVGCVDGSLVAILAPRVHPSEPAFVSRKGGHAINTGIVCDSDLKITAVTAKFGGAAHDSHVYNAWLLSDYLEAVYRSGEEGWLLGDSGYAQRPWLMTPILHAAEGSPEAYYTSRHVRTRVTVERCIGVLKARWRCIIHHRVLHYFPTKCGLIINACCVLHNLSLHDELPVDEPGPTGHPFRTQPAVPNHEATAEGQAAQARLVATLWDSRRRPA